MLIAQETFEIQPIFSGEIEISGQGCKTADHIELHTNVCLKYDMKVWLAIAEEAENTVGGFLSQIRGGLFEEKDGFPDERVIVVPATALVCQRVPFGEEPVQRLAIELAEVEQFHRVQLALAVLQAGNGGDVNLEVSRDLFLLQVRFDAGLPEPLPDLLACFVHIKVIAELGPNFSPKPV